jgi:ABC-type branched-subunit amino acid transport system ATPase component
MTVVLEVVEASVHFGGLKAVDGVSFQIERGRVQGLIGPNGAGKTTLFNAITGHVSLTHGQIILRGRDITGEPSHRRARLGLSRTFQLGGLIDDLTAIENVALGLDHGGRMDASRRLRAIELRPAARSLLNALDLLPIQDELASELPVGLRRQVEVLRAVAAQPELVLLDEPGAGLSELDRRHLASMISRLSSEGLNFLITDHSTDLVFAVSDDVLVMNFGQETARGAPEDVRRNPAVMEAYLGTQHDD